jgi:hypothetical protein
MKSSQAGSGASRHGRQNDLRTVTHNSVEL